MGSSSGLNLAPGQPRTLAYSSSIRRDLKLLEVADEAMLQELMGSSLCLKGAPGEEAVLCSSSKTYAVKNVETTNLLLLVQQDDAGAGGGGGDGGAPLASQDPNVQPTPPGVLLGLATQMQKNAAAAAQAPVVATAIAASHLELVAAAPRLHQLDALLWAHQYGADADGGEGAQMGGSHGGDGGAPGFSGGLTEGELLARVQCSAAELRAALRDRRALCLDGRWCMVDAGYRGMLLELVLLTAVEHGWPLSALPGGRVAAALQPHGYDPRVTLHCLATYGSPVGAGASQPGSSEAAAMDTDGAAAAHDAVADAAADAAAADAAADGSGSGGGGTWALDEAAVCLHFARGLLEAQPDWELGEFEEAWGRAVPEGLLPSLEMLRGEALQHGGGTNAAGMPLPRRLKHFPLARLPADAPSRFAALFAEKRRWEWEELEPYVRDLRGPGQTAEALLLKFTRASQPKPADPVTYSAR